MSNDMEIYDGEHENVVDNSQSVVKCAICQDSIAKNNVSFVDLCMHQYCFDCLKQWCEVKPECPLCKNKIEKIIHDIKSPQTYKEFVPPPTNRALLRAQLEHNFTDIDDNDRTVFQMIYPTDLFHLLPTVRTERLNLAQLTRFGLAGLPTSTDTATQTNEEITIESDSDDSDTEPFDTFDISVDDSNSDISGISDIVNDVVMNESQQSIISISSDSEESEHSDSDEGADTSTSSESW